LITQLKVWNYKNYTTGAFAFPDRLNFIVGRNGIGKTNLLDAIYYLCMARSHSTPQDRDTVRFEAEFFRIEATSTIGNVSHDLVIKVQPGSVKEILVDGTATSRLSDYVGFLPVVMLAPDDIVLIQGGSAARRRFMDLVICQLDKQYLEHLQHYQRLLAQRNALLRSEGHRADRKLLHTYSTAMAPDAAYIYAGRRQFMDDVMPEVLSCYTSLSASDETPGLQYTSHLSHQTLEKLAEASLETDMAACRTTQGSHKDDLVITLDGKAARKFGSQGQMKSLLIAMHIAQTHVLLKRTGRKPILLLDDIFDRLDDHRSAQLITILSDTPAAQVFISDASPPQMRELIRLSHTKASILELKGDVVAGQADSESRTLHEYESEEE
jgi:DNA replication and repair protein RecF